MPLLEALTREGAVLADRAPGRYAGGVGLALRYWAQTRSCDLNGGVRPHPLVYFDAAKEGPCLCVGRGRGINQLFKKKPKGDK